MAPQEASDLLILMPVALWLSLCRINSSDGDLDVNDV